MSENVYRKISRSVVNRADIASTETQEIIERSISLVTSAFEVSDTKEATSKDSQKEAESTNNR